MYIYVCMYVRMYLYLHASYISPLVSFYILGIFKSLRCPPFTVHRLRNKRKSAVVCLVHAVLGNGPTSL